jgi:hypothetical protein
VASSGTETLLANTMFIVVEIVAFRVTRGFVRQAELGARVAAAGAACELIVIHFANLQVAHGWVWTSSGEDFRMHGLP